MKLYQVPACRSVQTLFKSFAVFESYDASGLFINNHHEPIDTSLTFNLHTSEYHLQEVPCKL